MHADCRFLFLSNRLTWFHWEYKNTLGYNTIFLLRSRYYQNNQCHWDKPVPSGLKHSRVFSEAVRGILTPQINHNYIKWLIEYKQGELHHTPFKEASSESTTIQILKNVTPFTTKVPLWMKILQINTSKSPIFTSSIYKIKTSKQAKITAEKQLRTI